MPDPLQELPLLFGIGFLVFKHDPLLVPAKVAHAFTVFDLANTPHKIRQDNFNDCVDDLIRHCICEHLLLKAL